LDALSPIRGWTSKKPRNCSVNFALTLIGTQVWKSDVARAVVLTIITISIMTDLIQIV
jgi:hypothetical protein